MKNNRKTVLTLLGALLGLVFITLYYFFIMQSPVVRFLRPEVTKQEILLLADAFLKDNPGNHEALTQKVTTRINSKLLSYAQYYRKKNKEFPKIGVGYWHISWKDKKSNTSESEENKPFFVTYDFLGQLVGFKKWEKNLQIDLHQQLSEDDAYMEVIYFLESLNIDTRPLVIVNKEKNEKGKKIKYRFTFKNKLRQYPGLVESYIVEIMGHYITYFWHEKANDPQVTGDLDQKAGDKISDILMVLTLVVVAFILMVQFIRRLRRDELDFKRAFRLSIVVTFTFFLIFLLGSQENNTMEAIAMVILSFFLGALMLIIFPAAESQCRESWPEKLMLVDQLLQGKFLLRETGTAILHAFLLSGTTLFFIGGLLMVASHFDIGRIEFEMLQYIGLLNIPQLLKVAFKNILIPLLLGLPFFVFWPGYLRARFSSRFLVLSALTLTLVFFSGHYFFFRPVFFSALFILPIAIIWAVAIVKFEILTILLSIAGVSFFLDFSLVLINPDFFFTMPGMFIIIASALLLLLGIYLFFHSRSAGEFEDYVPEYVGRIAEKERILKELEIARSVQMRFLPQRVPQFHNLEIVSLCRPALQVGGDYYDFIHVDERYLHILIGDVSGKGVSAAFYMTMIKGIIKTLARKIKDPALLLSEANDIFYENATRGTFITVIYGVFDLVENTLTFASAGHNPLIVWKNDKQVTECYNPSGMALGLRNGKAFQPVIEEIAVPVGEGDIFVFYTDGVTEAMDIEQEIFGEQRLREVIETNSDRSACELERVITESVNRFSGEAPQHDDFTMVIVRVKEKNS